MFKKLLFIVSLLYSALFHSSAEVDYLKLKIDNRKNKILIPGGGSGKEFKPAEQKNFDSSCDKAIYYDDDGKIVIYLPKVENCDYDRGKEAKKQFENILNSELIENGNFDLRYVDVPAGWKSGSQISIYRQMPGIAVRIDTRMKVDGNNTERFPVLCATKSGGTVGEEGNATKFLTEESWESFFDKTVQKKQIFYYDKRSHNDVANAEFLDDGEHTERQLFYSLIYNNIISNGDRKIDLQGKAASNVRNSTFFVWTKGNPCITDSSFYHDNGGICCSVWYKNVLLPKLKSGASKIFIYFNSHSIPKGSVWLDLNKPGHRLLFGVLTGDQRPRASCYKPCNLQVEIIENTQVRITGGVVPNEISELLVNVESVNKMDEMTNLLSLTNGKIPYVVDLVTWPPSSYSFTAAGRQAVIDLLNRWMNGGGQHTIQFVDHYKN